MKKNGYLEMYLSCYKYLNKGTEPLIVTEVQASCGCTNVNWTRQPIKPNESGEISVTFNPKGLNGIFSKTIKVQSNSIISDQILTIKGTIVKH